MIPAKKQREEEASEENSPRSESPSPPLPHRGAKSESPHRPPDKKQLPSLRSGPEQLGTIQATWPQALQQLEVLKNRSTTASPVLDLHPDEHDQDFSDPDKPPTPADPKNSDEWVQCLEQLQKFIHQLKSNSSLPAMIVQMQALVDLTQGSTLKDLMGWVLNENATRLMRDQYRQALSKALPGVSVHHVLEFGNKVWINALDESLVTCLTLLEDKVTVLEIPLNIIQELVGHVQNRLDLSKVGTRPGALHFVPRRFSDDPKENLQFFSQTTGENRTTLKVQRQPTTPPDLARPPSPPPLPRDAVHRPEPSTPRKERPAMAPPRKRSKSESTLKRPLPAPPTPPLKHPGKNKMTRKERQKLVRKNKRAEWKDKRKRFFTGTHPNPGRKIIPGLMDKIYPEITVTKSRSKPKIAPVPPTYPIGTGEFSGEEYMPVPQNSPQNAHEIDKPFFQAELPLCGLVWTPPPRPSLTPPPARPLLPPWIKPREPFEKARPPSDNLNQRQPPYPPSSTQTAKPASPSHCYPEARRLSKNSWDANEDPAKSLRNWSQCPPTRAQSLSPDPEPRPLYSQALLRAPEKEGSPPPPPTQALPRLSPLMGRFTQHGQVRRPPRH